MPLNTFATQTTAIPLSQLDANFTFVSDSANLTFLQSGTGAVSRSVQAKLRDIYSVKDFGAIGDGVANDTAAVQLAITAMPSTGGMLYFPAGIYLVSTLAINKQMLIQGAGMFSGGTWIVASGAANKVFNVTTSSVTIRDLLIDKNVTQSGGAYIYCDTASSIVNIENVYMLGWYRGVHFAGVGNITMRHLRLTAGVATTGMGIRIDSGLAIFLEDVLVQNANGSEAYAGISVTNCGDITMVGCSFIENLYGMAIETGNGQNATSIYATNCFFDNNSNNGLLIKPTHASSSSHRMTFAQCWFSSSGASGVLLDTSAVAGAIDGIEFIGCEVYINASHGFQVQGSTTRRIKVLGGKFAQNTGSGLLFGANVSNWQVTDATIGPIGALTGNTTRGITSSAGTSNDVLIANNQLTGNTISALNIASTGARRRIDANHGYNPVGASGITVGASPYTYTAGDTPETVYINSGTVSSVATDAITLFQQTNCTLHLEPGKAVVVTYSVLPGMVKIVN